MDGSKDQLVSLVKSWIQHDNDIKEYQKTIRDHNKKKKDITSKLLVIMKNKQIDSFDTTGGKLIYSKTKVKAPLNKKTIMNALLKYYNDDVPNASKMSDFILDNREEKINESIRRQM